MLIGLIILKGAVGVLKECSDSLLDEAAKNVKLNQVEKVLKRVPDRAGIHDFNILSNRSANLANLSTR